MTFVDPIGDMLTRIRNAQMRSLSSVKIPASKVRAKILEVLKKEGYISDYKLSNDKEEKNSLNVDLAQINNLSLIVLSAPIASIAPPKTIAHIINQMVFIIPFIPPE